MIDPTLTAVLTKAFTYAVCGSIVAVVVRFMNRKQPGPRLDMAAAVGGLVGAAFGAFFGIFASLTGQ